MQRKGGRRPPAPSLAPLELTLTSTAYRVVPDGGGIATPGSEQRVYGIGELCHEFDVTGRTVRYYESCGILRPTRDGQRRLFGEGDRVRLRLALRGRRLGFSLAEVKEMLDLYDREGGEVAQLERTLAYGRAKLEELETKRKEVEEAIAELRAWQHLLGSRLRSAQRDADSGR